MPWTEALLILLAGMAAGTINTIVGSGTLVTFPTLLAFGFPSVTANVSNTIGLVAGGLSGTWGYRREVRTMSDQLKRLAPMSFLGAVVGALLLIVLPLIAGVLTRRRLGTPERVGSFVGRIKPWSVIGLIATVVILFALQGRVLVERPLVIAMIAVPILLQSYGIFAVGYAAAWLARVPFRIAAPCALIGTSNFFELAVAVAISIFGLNSGAALATVVGVLVEVPVMLTLVAFANRTRTAFPAEPGRA